MADKHADDPLARYRAKRDFAVTAEPRGERVGGDAARLAFVIQKHAASRLHYDFRLELDGVLLSWAVPKGPSCDPTDKRMAIQVEDHPLSYRSFEGTIPPKQYGAGSVIVWDRGHWEPIGDPRAGLAAGKLAFRLHGQKLAGAWELIRIAKGNQQQEAWLLFKKRDAHARSKADYDVVTALPDSVVAHPLKAPADDPGPAAAAPADSAAPSVPGAVRAELPQRLLPQLATLATAVPTAGTWICEIKFDGYRLMTRIENGQARLITRGGHDWSARMPALVRGIESLGVASGWLDGEIVVLGGDGVPDFNALQNAFDKPAPQARAEIDYFVFDVPFLEGHDLRQVALSSRRQILQALLAHKPTPHVRLSTAFDVDPAAVLASACRMKLEGIVAKRADSPYASRRTETWLKLKCRQRQEFVVCGYTDRSDGSMQIGSLLLTVRAGPVARIEQDGEKRSGSLSEKLSEWSAMEEKPDDSGNEKNGDKKKRSEKNEKALKSGDGGQWVSVGSVGTGWNARVAASLKSTLSRLEVDRSPLAAGAAKPGRWSKRNPASEHWVEPRLVVEVEFAEWTPDGQIRHAIYRGLREDKPAREVRREVALAFADALPVSPAGAMLVSLPGALPVSAAGALSVSTAGALPVPPTGALPVVPGGALTQSRAAARLMPPRRGAAAGAIKVTHADRVIDPASGLTKLQLVRYYESVADRMLPHLVGRPCALVRGPTGVTGHLFFQKHADQTALPGIRELDPTLWPGHQALIEVPDRWALASAAQMNVIEFHTWNALAKRIDQPDRMIFDLDPGDGTLWKHIQEAAMLVRGLLHELGLESWLKTSGGKGLHVVVPLTPRLSFDAVKDFSRAVVLHLARTIPSRFVARSGPVNRIGKLFVDCLRNGFGATTAAAYTARARPGLGVSMPVAWGDLPALKGGDQWTIATAREHLSFQNADPWAGYWKKRQTLTAAIKVLGSGASQGRA